MISDFRSCFRSKYEGGLFFGCAIASLNCSIVDLSLVIWLSWFHARMVDGMNDSCRELVVHLGVGMFLEVLRLYLSLSAVVSGRSSIRVSGAVLVFILYMISNFCFFLLSFSFSTPVSMYRLSWLVPRLAPVMALSPATCVCSISVFSFSLQLSQTGAAYSSRGLIKVLYILSSEDLFRR